MSPAPGTTAPAITRLMSSSNAARTQGAPGKCRPGVRNKANVPENIPGPKIIARPRSELRAPCNSPCSDGDTRRVIMDCEGAAASDHSAFTGMPTRKSHVVGARPNIRNPIAANPRPAKRDVRSPNLRTLQPTNTPDATTVATPTTARDAPICCLDQPKRSVVYSTK